jgi:hypothetical protein
VPPLPTLAGGLVVLPSGPPLRLSLTATRLLREGREVAGDARATLASDAGGWRLEGIAARVAEGSIGGAITADLRDGAPRLRAELTLAGLRPELEWPEARPRPRRHPARRRRLAQRQRRFGPRPCAPPSPARRGWN